MARARPWERFMTKDDLRFARPAPAIGFGERPALLLIDIYRAVFGDRPEPLSESIKRWPATCGLTGWKALPHIKRLLDASRRAKIPVIYSTNFYEDEEAILPWSKRGRAQARAGIRRRSPDERSDGSYEILPEIKPRPEDFVVRKTAPSVFSGTPLVAHLTSLGVDTIITAGESTSGCIRAAAVDGCTLRYRMVVVEECVFDRTEASHAINLFDMDQKYADIVSLDEAMRYLRGLTAGKRTK